MKRRLAKAVLMSLVFMNTVTSVSEATVLTPNFGSGRQNIVVNGGETLDVIGANGDNYNNFYNYYIENYGSINIKSGNDFGQIFFDGYIEQRDGNIKILIAGVENGLDGYIDESVFNGYIHYGPAGGNPVLDFVIDKGGVWITEGSSSDVVSNVTIKNGGIISLAGNFEKFYDRAWNDDYNYLMLHNFNTDGNWITNFDSVPNGGFVVHTDLANNKGDCVEFSGRTPNGKVPFLIINKNNNGGVPIKKEDGKSVTIAVFSGGWDGQRYNSTNMIVESKYMYANDGNIYKPIIEEKIGLYNEYISIPEYKEWNFVGWEAGEDERPKDKAKQEQIDHSILVEDVEPIFKRFNDLRTDPSEIGVWVRGETGETQIRNLSYDHNIMSGGYDWDYKNDAGVLFAGVGFTYSTNECDDKAIGDTKGYGFNAYGSWLGKKNNDYVDLVVKYGRLDKSYAGYDENDIFVAGEYDKDLFTIAAKYGRRIFKDDWYYEPSVGLTWGRVGSADFTDNHGTRIHADNSYSNIASLGIQVGKNIKGIEYYGKAEVMHDFDGKIHVSAPGRSVEDDMGGTWVKCAIGASRKIDENNSFYLEVERDFGNKVEKPYGFSAGYRFTW
ncbi:MAG: autotransporter outer membrane beta-barrel domain-containing protein [Phascolarctobacterium sp.]|nr:autotransporter outer membrane beta-barrel domain-containing protein [Phascolarctobacterium sp.]